MTRLSEIEERYFLGVDNNWNDVEPDDVRYLIERVKELEISSERWKTQAELAAQAMRQIDVMNALNSPEIADRLTKLEKVREAAEKYVESFIEPNTKMLSVENLAEALKEAKEPEC